MNTTLIREDLVGLVIDGRFPLLQRLGGGAGSSAFLTEFGDPRQKATIKLIPADFEGAELRLAAWEAAQKFSHPNVVQVFAHGRCELDSGPMLYIVSEFADEVLAGILPDRALTAHEAREMLGPTLDALSYLHEKGFVHSHLKPSNIMAVGDRLKLSADCLVSQGATQNPSAERIVYDAPETTQGPIGAAADMWSLGATLIEVFAQRSPAWDNNPAQIPVVPESVPQPFAMIARQCLRIDPARRCTIEQIQSRLAPPPAHTAAPEHADGKTIARRRMGVSIGAGAVLLATIAIWTAYEFHHEPLSQEPESQSAASASPVPASPAASVATPSTPVPSREEPASPTPPPAASSAASAPSSSVVPAEAPTPASPEAHPSPAPTQPSQSSGGATAQGEVSQQVQPDVPASAMRTISGTVKVAVKVSVDAAGSVTNADFDSAGPSKYFANKALEASRHFAFRPARDGGQPVASTWILHFDFRREGISITSAETTP